MAEDPPAEGEPAPKKKTAMMMTVVAVGVLTLVGAGGGWVVGGMLAPDLKASADAAKEQAGKEAAPAHAAANNTDEEGLPHISTEENGVVRLEPITSNLAFPTDRWIRLEVALLFKGKADVVLAEDIHQDIMKYLRTVTMQQIEGPRGFLYLKEDLQERADLISEGKVARIMFRTFVIE